MRRLLLCALLFLSPAAMAQMAMAGELHVSDVWSRELPPVAPNGAAYLSVRNAGASADRLVGASTDIADAAELHTHQNDAGVMKMRRVEGVDVPAGESVVFQPGGLHVMLMGLKKPLVKGESFRLRLRFERAGEVALEVPIMGMGHKGGSTGHSMKQGHGEKSGHDMKHSKPKTASQ